MANRKLYDGRKLISRSSWCVYPDGEFKNWGSPGHDTRIDLTREVFETREGMHEVIWRRGEIIYTREQITELIKQSKTFRQNKY